MTNNFINHFNNKDDDHEEVFSNFDDDRVRNLCCM